MDLNLSNQRRQALSLNTTPEGNTNQKGTSIFDSVLNIFKSPDLKKTSVSGSAIISGSLSLSGEKTPLTKNSPNVLSTAPYIPLPKGTKFNLHLKTDYFLKIST